LLVAVAGTMIGPAGLRPTELWEAIQGGGEDRTRAILFKLRLPRVALGALVGAALATAGAAYQGVFRNLLVDPYLLGVAAGAGLGATVAITAGWPLVPLAAFVGAIAAVVITYLVGRSLGGRTATSLVLAGVAAASFFTALQTFILQRENDSLREVYAWILGRLSTAGWSEVRQAAPYVVVSLVVILLHRRLLDALAVGDEEAAGLGIHVASVRFWVVCAATLGTAAAVSVSGLISFVGVIVPHAIRLVVGSSYRAVLPLAALLGAAFLIAADLAARTVLAPAELPIGVITALCGAPFFVAVLRTSRRSL
jgi:iron complex transport system permease protein